MARTLSTADDRREAVLEAAVPVFAARGFHGTPTMPVAKAAGISQAYLFRLFPTKDELALAVVEHVCDRIFETFAKAAKAAEATDEPPRDAMGAAYGELMQDSDHLACMLHGQIAALENDAIRDVMQDCFKRIYELVLAVGSTPEEAGRFLLIGTTLNAMQAMRVIDREAEELAGSTEWAQAMLLPLINDPSC